MIGYNSRKNESHGSLRKNVALNGGQCLFEQLAEEKKKFTFDGPGLTTKRHYNQSLECKTAGLTSVNGDRKLNVSSRRRKRVASAALPTNVPAVTART